MLALVLAALSFLAIGCQKDSAADTDSGRELSLYLLACPTGPFACYESCTTQNDANGNGTIEGAETFNFNICAQSCQSRCSFAFLFYVLNNEE
ncbi:MAG: hypothetical protein K1X75_07955 [Leptospirales bacterium]|nr:hypothetical protein [Leptospirales bacterium]